MENWEPRMWFGNQNSMQWVPCPSVGSEFGRKKWSNKVDYLNGGSYVRSSVADHREYSLTWDRVNRADSRKVTDYANGIYGTGLIYFIDPFAADANVLPMSFAYPALGAEDGPILNGTYVRPTTMPTSPNSLGYPTLSAVYTMSGSNAYGTWVPIPPGYTLWIGAHGSSSGGTVDAVGTADFGGETTSNSLTLLTESTATRVNYSLDWTQAQGAYIRLGGTGTITLSGIIAQLLPSGQVPPEGGYISGQGHSGCRFDGAPQEEQYSAYYDQVGLTANLVEVGAWL